MQIQVTDSSLTFDGISVRYEHRYLPRAVLLDVLREWGRRLTTERAGQTIYLPFSVDDEFIEVFEVEPNGEQISLRLVKLDGIGYVAGVDAVSEAIMRDRPVVERLPAAFLVCDRTQLLEAVERVVAAG